MNFIFKICIIPSVVEHSGHSKTYLALFLERIISGYCTMLDRGSRKRLQKVQPHGPLVSRAGISRRMNVKLDGEKETMQMVQFSSSKT